MSKSFIFLSVLSVIFVEIMATPSQRQPPTPPAPPTKQPSINPAGGERRLLYELMIKGKGKK